MDRPDSPLTLPVQAEPYGHSRNTGMTKGRLTMRLLLTVTALVALLASAAQAQGEIRRFELIARSDTLTIGDGVTFKGFTFNGTMPGPQMVVREGDTVEITVRNEDTVAHGLSIHAANAQTSNFVGHIPPGETRTLTFTADFPGVFMYHCAPGGHGIMVHTMGGQFGMFVVEPKEPYRMEQELGRAPDLKVYLVQHEVYASGRDFFDGQALYVMFNGETFRYVREPIPARPGDYVRFYYLNVGPNLTSTFHAVGGIWDYIYYGGNPKNLMRGTQSVISGPTDSWVIEWIVPGEGPFTLVTHAFGTQAIKGAVGVLLAAEDAPRVGEIRSEGPSHALAAEPRRLVDPFGPGSETLDVPVRFRPGDRVQIQMVGNSFWPKRAEVPVGTTVTWINEDVFDFLGPSPEFTGRHNAVVIAGVGNERFVSPLLKHAETWSFTFNEPGEYEYFCTLHPYMRGKITVYAQE
ncbi:MAG: multicopper oxidase domain-containing protein [Truepera sp.]|nr:multicopper oxidase domain-containing protein [Truepera sp.]